MKCGVVKLSGQEDYRIRVGDYRVIYEIDDVGKATRSHRSLKPKASGWGALGWGDRGLTAIVERCLPLEVHFHRYLPLLVHRRDAPAQRGHDVPRASVLMEWVGQAGQPASSA